MSRTALARWTRMHISALWTGTTLCIGGGLLLVQAPAEVLADPLRTTGLSAAALATATLIGLHIVGKGSRQWEVVAGVFWIVVPLASFLMSGYLAIPSGGE